MNPADIYWAYQELYRIAPTLSQEEYQRRDRELFRELKAIGTDTMTDEQLYSRAAEACQQADELIGRQATTRPTRR